jgi:large subunit ribosomal protein L23
MKNDAYKVILRPVVSEKTHGLTRGSRGGKDAPPLGQYTFEVARDSTKGEIRAAVEELFNVKVSRVNTLHVRGRLRRVRRSAGLTRSWKKAVVTLAPGNTIDLY